MKRRLLLACASGIPFVITSMPAFAQTESSSTAPVAPASGGRTGQGTQAPVSTDATTGAPGTTGLAQSATTQNGDIIVTAQKRSQRLQDVGLTIQAADAGQIAERGIASPADLGKLVPGFTATQSLYSTPVYTLRGIGLYDATFSASPAVAIYTDQIPRNVPVMSEALDLDLDRIEVLKGPQGTLFGQSATGGAINYILGKPTDTMHYGFDASVERFGRVSGAFFVSGPLTDTLAIRVAGRITYGGAYQYSISRPDDHNGATRKEEVRTTLDWNPTDRLKIEAIGTIVNDTSDVQAPQYVGTELNTYSTASLAAANANPATRNPYGVVNNALYASITTPGSPNYDASFLGRQTTVETRLNTGGARFQPGAQAILGTPIETNSNRAAEWTPGLLGPSDNVYYQGSLRLDYKLTDALTFTSVSALAKQTLKYAQDLDATVAQAVDVPIFGNVTTFNQEVRLALDTHRVNAIIGGSYDNVRSNQTNYFDLYDYTGNAPLGGPPYIELTKNAFSSKQHTYAGFGNIEYHVIGGLSVLGGVRYTQNNQQASYCYSDPNGAGADAVFTIFEGLFTGKTQPALQANQCFPLGDGLNGTTFGISTISPVNRTLDQHNVSFRGGVNYKFDGGTLVYATVSQGYKSGIFSAIGASSVSQYAPATQEKVISYEGGFKTSFAERKVQLNAAGFYYDYSNKQVRGRIADPIYGLLEKLINVPKSYVYGVEADVLIRPVPGLTVSASGTYLKSKVTSDFTQTPDGSAVYNAAGYTGNFRGSALPFTPKFSANADIQYELPANGGARPFVGGNMLYQGSENATFETNVLRADDFYIAGYVTVDLRAGVESADGRYKLSLFGRNVLNKNYTTSITTYLDTRFRFTGRPATYGASISYRY